jgi:hypothetical protein
MGDRPVENELARRRWVVVEGSGDYWRCYLPFLSTNMVPKNGNKDR